MYESSPKAFMRSLTIGGECWLNSGSPPLIVSHVLDDKVTVKWMAGLTGPYLTEVFPAECLRASDPKTHDAFSPPVSETPLTEPERPHPALTSRKSGQLPNTIAIRTLFNEMELREKRGFDLLADMNAAREAAAQAEAAYRAAISELEELKAFISEQTTPMVISQ